MDLNPHQFKAPFDDFEFANAMLNLGPPDLICCSNAWLLSDAEKASSDPLSPSIDTIRYWAIRLSPLFSSRSPEKGTLVDSGDTSLSTGTPAHSKPLIIAISNRVVPLLLAFTFAGIRKWRSICRVFVCLFGWWGWKPFTFGINANIKDWCACCQRRVEGTKKYNHFHCFL